MKKYILLALLVSVLGTTVAFAHPPSMVNAVFDKEKSNLIVSFVHKVNAPNNHYVKQIKVSIGKRDLVIQNNFSQETDNGGTLYYKLIDAKVGDKITVNAQCNKMGAKSTTIEVK